MERNNMEEQKEVNDIKLEKPIDLTLEIDDFIDIINDKNDAYDINLRLME